MKIIKRNGAEAVFAQVLKGFEFHQVGEVPVGYRCYCSRERVQEAISCVDNRDLEDMIRENRVTEVSCQFCDASYRFTPQDLQTILDSKK